MAMLQRGLQAGLQVGWQAGLVGARGCDVIFRQK